MIICSMLYNEDADLVECDEPEEYDEEEYNDDEQDHDFDEPVVVEYDNRGNCTYEKWSDGTWEKWYYNKNDKRVYFENNNGYWAYWEYFSDLPEVLKYQSRSDGWWSRSEFDNKGNMIYLEYSDGDWYCFEYDESGKVLSNKTKKGYNEKLKSIGPRIDWDLINGKE